MHFKRLGIHRILNIRYSRLEEVLSVTHNHHLLHAFVHPSFNAHIPGLANYERLEFLGDALIYAVMSDVLLVAYPDYTPSLLSVLRQKYITTSTLVAQARKLGLDKMVLVSANTRLPEDSRVFADIYESFVGAIYLTFGNKVARNFIIGTLHTPELIASLNADKDAKTLLQELFQSVSDEKVSYQSTVLPSGLFQVSITHSGMVYGVGEGRTKKVAEKCAAEAALQKLSCIQDEETNNLLFARRLETLMEQSDDNEMIVREYDDSEHVVDTITSADHTMQTCGGSHNRSSQQSVESGSYDLIWSINSAEVV